MNRTSRLALALLVAASLAAVAVASADPFDRFRQPARPVRPPRVQTPGFHVSGTYSGSVGGQLILDGVSYPLRTNTLPYLVGYGPIAVNQVPIGSRVFATIVSGNQGDVIWGLIVRPADEDRATRGDLAPAARVHDPNAPR